MLRMGSSEVQSALARELCCTSTSPDAFDPAAGEGIHHGAGAGLDQNTAENAENQILSHQQRRQINKLTGAGSWEQWHCWSLPVMGIISPGCHGGDISFILTPRKSSLQLQFSGLDVTS